MRSPNTLNMRTLLFFTAGISLFVWLAACSSPKPTQQGPRRYALRGRVISVEKARQQVVVDHEAIPGFMGAMAMPYTVKDTRQLESISPEDQITADVVANGRDIWLENIVVVKKAAQPQAPSPNKSQSSPPQPGKH